MDDAVGAVMARRGEARGYTLAELLVALLIGSVILLALSSLYMATQSALAASVSQSVLQRTGQDALEEVARRARKANALLAGIAPGAPGCAPGGSNGPWLQVTVEEPANSGANFNYCYYAGTGANGGLPGTLCENRAGAGCRNLLGAGGTVAGGGTQAGVTRQGVPTGILLLTQTAAPGLAQCPSIDSREFTTPSPSVTLAAGQSCFAAALDTFGGGTVQTSRAIVGFAITDNINFMTFGVTLKLRN